MSKKSNIIFCLIISSVMLCTIVFQIGIASLDSVTVSKKSDLENRVYTVCPTLSKKTFLDGSFQEEMESYLSDSIPNRNKVLMCDALIQRKAIELANMPFGFSIYPTFFDSYIGYSPELGALFPFPAKQNKGKYSAKLTEEYEKFFEAIIAALPNASYCYFLPDRSTITNRSPAQELTSNSADRAYCMDYLKKVLPKKITLIDFDYSAKGDYNSCLFKTDHHFQIQGAIDAYTEICLQIGVTPIKFGEKYTVFDDSFFGSSAREGRIDIIADTVENVQYEASELIVTIDGKKVSSSDIDRTAFSDNKNVEKTRCYENMYATCFHHDYGFISIENRSIENDDALLLVSDSFDNSLDKFFAENYRYVYELDPRHYKSGEEILDFLSSTPKIKNVVFILSIESLPEVVKNCEDIL